MENGLVEAFAYPVGLGMPSFGLRMLYAANPQVKAHSHAFPPLPQYSVPRSVSILIIPILWAANKGKTLSLSKSAAVIRSFCRVKFCACHL